MIDRRVSIRESALALLRGAKMALEDGASAYQERIAELERELAERSAAYERVHEQQHARAEAAEAELTATRQIVRLARAVVAEWVESGFLEDPDAVDDLEHELAAAVRAAP